MHVCMYNTYIFLYNNCKFQFLVADCDLGKELEHEVPPSSKGKGEEGLAVEVVEPEKQKKKPTWRPKHKKRKKKQKKGKQGKPSGRQHGKPNDCSGRKDTQATENCNHRGTYVNNARNSNYQQRGPSRECNGDESDSDEDNKSRGPKFPRGHYAGIQQQEDESMSVESPQKRSEDVSATARLVAQEQRVPECFQLRDVRF